MVSARSQCQRPPRDSYAIILPAGFGKTEYIVDYACKQQRCTLILTHTNAGVFALRNRLTDKEIDSGFRVLTIAAWCESWVSAYPALTQYSSFCDSKENEPDAYFKRLYEGMLYLSARSWFRKTMQASYGSIVVDEYQDCTKGQHALFLEMTKFMKLVVLGDPLQGIFYWIKDDSLVDWNQLSLPVRELDSKPWRWINAGCPELGKYISDIRTDLLPVLNGHPVQVPLDRACPNVLIVSQEKIGRAQHWNDYGTVVYITSVKNVQYAFSKRHIRFQSNEPVDNKEAASACFAFDHKAGAKLALAILDFASLCFTNTSQQLKSYRSRLEKGSFDFGRIRKHPEIGLALKQINLDASYRNTAALLDAIKEDGSFRLHRGILYSEVRRALRMATVEGSSASEALKAIRSQHKSFEEISPPYRLLSSRTVLSKGLEYDTAIVDAVGIKDARDFYVAISRCKRKLIIVSDTNTLSFPAVSK